MVNGPIVGDAIRDPSNRIVTFTEGEKDDAKVVEEVYLGVLGRRPTAKEVEIGKKAIAECATDYAALAKEYGKYKSAFDDYSKSIDAKMPAYEEKLKAQRPTTWSVAKPKTIESKAGEAADKLSKSSTVKQLDDGSVLVTGTTEKIDIYTLSFEAKADKPITGLRLEVLPDDALPAKGPGRAQNGNFVLHELKVTTKVDGKDVAAKLKDPQADFSQDSFPVQNVIDGNLGTGWAVAPQLGQGHIAVFAFDKPIDAAKATAIGLVLDQRFGTGHTIGKFRISFTSDDKPKLKAGTASDVLAILDMPKEKRTSDQQGRIRAMYEAQDGEFHRLRAAIPVAPPKDARAIGAQDLAWALMNTPAFLFNR